LKFLRSQRSNDLPSLSKVRCMFILTSSGSTVLRLSNLGHMKVVELHPFGATTLHSQDAQYHHSTRTAASIYPWLPRRQHLVVDRDWFVIALALCASNGFASFAGIMHNVNTR
jgi:hypothetical protein